MTPAKMEMPYAAPPGASGVLGGPVVVIDVPFG
jgi:hypothetical protein